MKEFIVVLSSGSEVILATDSEHAAWQALELAYSNDVKLIDVRPYAESMW